MGLGGLGLGLLWDCLRFLYSLCKCVLLRNPHGAYRVSSGGKERTYKVMLMKRRRGVSTRVGLVDSYYAQQEGSYGLFCRPLCILGCIRHTLRMHGVLATTRSWTGFQGRRGHAVNEVMGYEVTHSTAVQKVPEIFKHLPDNLRPKLSLPSPPLPSPTAFPRMHFGGPGKLQERVEERQRGGWHAAAGPWVLSRVSSVSEDYFRCD